MAAPLLVATPWLASFIGGILAAIVRWLAKFLTEKLAIRVGVFLGFVLLVGTFTVALDALASTIGVVFPSEPLQYMGHFVPTGGSTIFAAVISAKLLAWVFQWKVYFITLYAT